ncbi:MAG: phosphatidate cytidylyltransferase [Clostridia bacterium]|nr:phosphatidate cytidylyltransferase [Clostridia bacterium]
MKEFGIRAVVAIGLISLLALTVWLGGWVQVAVLTLFAVIGITEMYKMFGKKDVRICIVPLLLVAASQFVVLYLFPKYVPIVYIIGFLWIVADRILNGRASSEGAAASCFVLIYPLALLLCFGLFGFERNDVSRIALIIVFAGPSMADNNAYMFGKLFGKHKLCPKISPNKTVEGFIAGLIGGPIGGLLVYFLQRLWGLNVHWGWLVGLGFIGGVIGQAGDLFASTFKRWSGIKDFGSIFPKHGGVIDRLDSAMMFAPVVAAFFNYLFR